MSLSKVRIGWVRLGCFKENEKLDRFRRGSAFGLGWVMCRLKRLKC